MGEPEKKPDSTPSSPPREEPDYTVDKYGREGSERQLEREPEEERQ